ncbi:MAG: 50S ribosomal protein L3 [Candidatus Aenigmatarchaeota archaeon]|nr:MAG: 50S ribosomal protein L3 [Candidatus Aenigmarchaeota archaeon]
MPKVHRPRRGSLQYWPRKRAARIHPNVSIDSAKVTVEGTRPLAFAAYKAGMTHLIAVDAVKGSPSFNQPIAVPVSVLDAPPLLVLGFRCYAASGRSSVASFDVYADGVPKELRVSLKSKHKAADVEKNKNVDNVRLIVSTQPTKSGIAKKTPEIFEVDIGGKLGEKIKYASEKLGKEITVGEVFNEGQFIDVTAITKGKGFQGVVKRFGIRVRGRKDEQGHRKIGIHGPERMGRILYSVPMAGQLGFFRRTEHNKQIFRISSDGFSPKGGFVGYGAVPKTMIFLKGSIPGSKKRLVVLRAPLRASSKGYPIAIQEVSVASQQGMKTR